MFYFFYFSFEALYLLVRFLYIEAGDAAHRLIDKLFIVLGNYRPVELREEWLEQTVQDLNYNLKIIRRFVVRMLIHPFLDKYLEQRAEEYFFHQFFQPDLQLHFQQALSVMRAFGKHIINTDKAWLIIQYYAGIGRYRNLAIPKGIQCVNSYIRRNARRQVNYDLYILGCIILYLLYLDLALLVGGNNAFHQSPGGGAERYFSNRQGLFISLDDLCADTHLAPSLALIV